MTRNLKPLGLALAAILAMGAMAAQGASATIVEHEFHADGENAVVTGTNKIVPPNTVGTETSVHEIAIGGAGTWRCNKVETESTQEGTLVSAGTYKTDTITVIPHYSECTFGGNPLTVNFNHCAYVFDSDTTEEAGTPTPGAHANVEIECSGGSEIEIDTTLCTITVGPQTIKHAVRYENDPHNKNAVKFIFTAHKVKTGKKKTTESQTGCLLFPTGEIGTYTGKVTARCFRDDGSKLGATETTTPTGQTVEGPETECKVSNL